jgi:uncharacterized protein YjdB
VLRARARRARAICAAFAAPALAAGCGESVAPRATVAAVVAQPQSLTLGLGRSHPLVATVTDARGNVLTDRAVFWGTSDAAVVTVGEDGVATAVAAGSAQIAASAEGKSGLVAVTVVPRSVARVVVAPPAATIAVGREAQLTAQTLDAEGLELVGRGVLWATSDESVASVGAEGLVTAHAAGSATITATSEGVHGSASVIVTAQPIASITIAPPSLELTVGESSRLTATVRDASDAPVPGAPVAWSTSAPPVATVAADGTVTAHAPGSATITAASGSVTATVPVTVEQAPVATVTVAPSSVRVAPGATAQLSATLRDARGNVLTGRPVAWSTSAGGIATVTAAGLVRGVAPGTATVTATAEGRSGSATVTVTSGTPAQLVKVSGDDQSAPRRTTLPQPLVVRVLDAQGSPVPNVPVTWFVSKGGGSVSPWLVLTDGGGYASTRFTLGNGRGSHEATAFVVRLRTVTFDATAR